MAMFVARILILMMAGGFAALGIPREWVDPLVNDPEVALALSVCLMALWKEMWRLAKKMGAQT